MIVSPHFPPVNAPDMQRVRIGLPYYREFGWRPYVLAVAPSGSDRVDPLLVETVPADVAVDRVRSIPLWLTRPIGVGNVALRAMPFIYARGSRVIAAERIDLVFFSTTMFLAMPLGRLWRRAWGVPYVLDIQDPWHSDYYERHPESAPPPKYGLARRLHARLEPWTMERVSGIIAVSEAYVATLRARYPWLTEEMCMTLPFGYSALDFELLASRPQPNRCFSRPSALRHGVYVGRGGDDMRPALRVLFRALKAGLEAAPDLFGRVALHFLGTDYATDHRARRSVAPVAAEIGVGAYVEERTERLPYFEALQLLRDADFLLLVGSDDPGYSASKVYPYLAAGKPILAVVHERSSLVRILQDARAHVVTFSEGRDLDAPVRQAVDAWRRLLDGSGAAVGPGAASLEEAYSAREMVRRQCLMFDRVLEGVRRRAA